MKNLNTIDVTNINNWMIGQVRAWNDSTQTLEITVQHSNGSGTISNWNFGSAAPKGEQGDPGATNTAGDGTVSLPGFAFLSDQNTGWYHTASADTWHFSTNATLQFDLAPDGFHVQGNNFPFLGMDGSAANPAFKFENDPDNGMYLKNTNSVGWSTAGVERMHIDANGQFHANTIREWVRLLEIKGKVEDETITVIPDSPITFTILAVRGECTVGSCDATGKINNINLGGSHTDVATSSSIDAHSSTNSVAVGDDVSVEITNSSACENVMLWAEIERAL